MIADERSKLSRIFLGFFPTSVVLALLVGACATTEQGKEAASEIQVQPAASTQSTQKAMEPTLSSGQPVGAIPLYKPAGSDGKNSDMLLLSSPNLQQPPKAVVYPGSGDFINRRKAATRTSSATGFASSSGRGLTLQFEAVSIRDVVKAIFETLNQNYVIDPQVNGLVTVQTSRPLANNQLLPTLETLLRMNGAVLVREGGVYRILPAAGVLKQGKFAPKLRGSGVGYGVRIVPLRYVSAAEMQAIIAPLLPEGGVLRVDVARNLLVLAGTAQELASIQETIDTFDVNWLRGMSIAMFRLRNLDSRSMASELNQLLGEGSGTPIAGLVRLVPLTKLNAILVITPQKEYLREIAVWIERLDGISGERLYIYPVQNSSSDYMAELLNGLFNSGGGGGSSGGQLAPGLKPKRLSGGQGNPEASNNGSKTSTSSKTSKSGGTSAGAPSLGGYTPDINAGAGSSGRGGLSSFGSGGPSAGMEEVRIVADVENNSLLIWASAPNYERILNTLRKIDVVPRQVLIEATIIEVTLTGQLQYGLQWYLTHGIADGFKGLGSLGLNTNVEINNALAAAPKGSFSYAIADSAGFVRAFLNLLAKDSKVKVLSSPHVMVVDNQQAVIRVGTQQPVSGQQTIVDSNVVQSFDYKDTGILLEVLPRINSGGMVNMDIKQEVIDVGTLDEATKQRAFLQRAITSKVAVKDGNTLVLGGLIRDNRTEAKSGIPVLYRLPVVGPLFGSTNEQIDRTELIVLLTPRVVENTEDVDGIIRELKSKMQEILPALENISG
ncbi:MAG: type II secretion system protein GspD [Candidatus Contendobacter odensis]|uniref:Type II secretion system protein GspD n=1 Tax=Candidatus Contendibacter odensensis TaxID=1400860 RepID=A0A2G6PE67_9GAMM|nr:MAG: type II secretion system protein GspD [Candidatus Contendobacter odensis]